ncbi:unnamed protein product [Amoebophrya sp. A120]|nr:unnamed protein product [Amoebophrya sp. A120]|eukprot:GSA120T00003639001.1
MLGSESLDLQQWRPPRPDHETEFARERRRHLLLTCSSTYFLMRALLWTRARRVPLPDPPQFPWERNQNAPGQGNRARQAHQAEASAPGDGNWVDIDSLNLRTELDTNVFLDSGNGSRHYHVVNTQNRSERLVVRRATAGVTATEDDPQYRSLREEQHRKERELAHTEASLPGARAQLRASVQATQNLRDQINDRWTFRTLPQGERDRVWGLYFDAQNRETRPRDQVQTLEGQQRDLTRQIEGLKTNRKNHWMRVRSQWIKMEWKARALEPWLMQVQNDVIAPFQQHLDDIRFTGAAADVATTSNLDQFPPRRADRLASVFGGPTRAQVRALRPGQRPARLTLPEPARSQTALEWLRGRREPDASVRLVADDEPLGKARAVVRELGRGKLFFRDLLDAVSPEANQQQAGPILEELLHRYERDRDTARVLERAALESVLFLTPTGTTGDAEEAVLTYLHRSRSVWRMHDLVRLVAEDPYLGMDLVWWREKLRAETAVTFALVEKVRLYCVAYLLLQSRLTQTRAVLRELAAAQQPDHVAGVQPPHELTETAARNLWDLGLSQCMRYDPAVYPMYLAFDATQGLMMWPAQVETLKKLVQREVHLLETGQIVKTSGFSPRLLRQPLFSSPLVALPNEISSAASSGVLWRVTGFGEDKRWVEVTHPAGAGLEAGGPTSTTTGFVWYTDLQVPDSVFLPGERVRFRSLPAGGDQSVVRNGSFARVRYVANSSEGVQTADAFLVLELEEQPGAAQQPPYTPVTVKLDYPTAYAALERVEDEAESSSSPGSTQLTSFTSVSEQLRMGAGKTKVLSGRTLATVGSTHRIPVLVFTDALHASNTQDIRSTVRTQGKDVEVLSFAVHANGTVGYLSWLKNKLLEAKRTGQVIFTAKAKDLQGLVAAVNLKFEKLRTLMRQVHDSQMWIERERRAQPDAVGAEEDDDEMEQRLYAQWLGLEGMNQEYRNCVVKVLGMDEGRLARKERPEPECANGESALAPLQERAYQAGETMRVLLLLFEVLDILSSDGHTLFDEVDSLLAWNKQLNLPAGDRMPVPATSINEVMKIWWELLMCDSHELAEEVVGSGSAGPAAVQPPAAASPSPLRGPDGAPAAPATAAQATTAAAGLARTRTTPAPRYKRVLDLVVRNAHSKMPQSFYDESILPKLADDVCRRLVKETLGKPQKRPGDDVAKVRFGEGQLQRQQDNCKGFLLSTSLHHFSRDNKGMALDAWSFINTLPRTVPLYDQVRESGSAAKHVLGNIARESLSKQTNVHYGRSQIVHDFEGAMPYKAAETPSESSKTEMSLYKDVYEAMSKTILTYLSEPWDAEMATKDVFVLPGFATSTESISQRLAQQAQQAGPLAQKSRRVPQKISELHYQTRRLIKLIRRECRENFGRSDTDHALKPPDNFFLGVEKFSEELSRILAEEHVHVNNLEGGPEQAHGPPPRININNPGRSSARAPAGAAALPPAATAGRSTPAAASHEGAPGATSTTATEAPEPKWAPLEKALWEEGDEEGLPTFATVVRFRHLLERNRTNTLVVPALLMWYLSRMVFPDKHQLSLYAVQANAGSVELATLTHQSQGFSGTTADEMTQALNTQKAMTRVDRRGRGELAVTYTDEFDTAEEVRHVLLNGHTSVLDNLDEKLLQRPDRFLFEVARRSNVDDQHRTEGSYPGYHYRDYVGGTLQPRELQPENRPAAVKFHEFSAFIDAGAYFSMNKMPRKEVACRLLYAWNTLNADKDVIAFYEDKTPGQSTLMLYRYQTLFPSGRFPGASAAVADRRGREDNGWLDGVCAKRWHREDEAHAVYTTGEEDRDYWCPSDDEEQYVQSQCDAAVLPAPLEVIGSQYESIAEAAGFASVQELEWHLVMYYDQAHVIGADVKWKNRALMSLSDKTGRDAAAQGAMRARGLFKPPLPQYQFITFVIERRVSEVIKRFRADAKALPALDEDEAAFRALPEAERQQRVLAHNKETRRRNHTRVRYFLTEMERTVAEQAAAGAAPPAAADGSGASGSSASGARSVAAAVQQLNHAGREFQISLDRTSGEIGVQEEAVVAPASQPGTPTEPGGSADGSEEEDEDDAAVPQALVAEADARFSDEGDLRVRDLAAYAWHLQDEGEKRNFAMSIPMQLTAMTRALLGTLRGVAFFRPYLGNIPDDESALGQMLRTDTEYEYWRQTEVAAPSAEDTLRAFQIALGVHDRIKDFMLVSYENPEWVWQTYSPVKYMVNPLDNVKGSVVGMARSLRWNVGALVPAQMLRAWERATYLWVERANLHLDKLPTRVLGSKDTHSDPNGAEVQTEVQLELEQDLQLEVGLQLDEAPLARDLRAKATNKYGLVAPLVVADNENINTFGDRWVRQHVALRLPGMNRDRVEDWVGRSDQGRIPIRGGYSLLPAFYAADASLPSFYRWSSFTAVAIRATANLVARAAPLALPLADQAQRAGEERARVLDFLKNDSELFRGTVRARTILGEMQRHAAPSWRVLTDDPNLVSPDLYLSSDAAQPWEGLQSWKTFLRPMERYLQKALLVEDKRVRSMTFQLEVNTFFEVPNLSEQERIAVREWAVLKRNGNLEQEVGRPVRRGNGAITDLSRPSQLAITALGLWPRAPGTPPEPKPAATRARRALFEKVLAQLEKSRLLEAMVRNPIEKKYSLLLQNPLDEVAQPNLRKFEREQGKRLARSLDDASKRELEAELKRILFGDSNQLLSFVANEEVQEPVSAVPAAVAVVDPAAGEPAQPAPVEPALPAAGVPVPPAAGARSPPAAVEPAQPAAVEPAQPSAGVPVPPAAGEPAQPPAGVPVQPAAVEPAQPSAGVPAPPAAGQPAASTTAPRPKARPAAKQAARGAAHNAFDAIDLSLLSAKFSPRSQEDVRDADANRALWVHSSGEDSDFVDHSGGEASDAATQPSPSALRREDRTLTLTFSLSVKDSFFNAGEGEHPVTSPGGVKLRAALNALRSLVQDAVTTENNRGILTLKELKPAPKPTAVPQQPQSVADGHRVVSPAATAEQQQAQGAVIGVRTPAVPATADQQPLSPGAAGDAAAPAGTSQDGATGRDPATAQPAPASPSDGASSDSSPEPPEDGAARNLEPDTTRGWFQDGVALEDAAQDFEVPLQLAAPEKLIQLQTALHKFFYADSPSPSKSLVARFAVGKELSLYTRNMSPDFLTGTDEVTEAQANELAVLRHRMVFLTNIETTRFVTLLRTLQNGGVPEAQRLRPGQECDSASQAFQRSSLRSVWVVDHMGAVAGTACWRPSLQTPTLQLQRHFREVFPAAKETAERVLLENSPDDKRLQAENVMFSFRNVAAGPAGAQQEPGVAGKADARDILQGSKLELLNIVHDRARGKLLAQSIFLKRGIQNLLQHMRELKLVNTRQQLPESKTLQEGERVIVLNEPNPNAGREFCPVRIRTELVPIPVQAPSAPVSSGGFLAPRPAGSQGQASSLPPQQGEDAAPEEDPATERRGRTASLPPQAGSQQTVAPQQGAGADPAAGVPGARSSPVVPTAGPLQGATPEPAATPESAAPRGRASSQPPAGGAPHGGGLAAASASGSGQGRTSSVPPMMRIRQGETIFQPLAPTHPLIAETATCLYGYKEVGRRRRVILFDEETTVQGVQQLVRDEINARNDGQQTRFKLVVGAPLQAVHALLPESLQGAAASPQQEARKRLVARFLPNVERPDQTAARNYLLSLTRDGSPRPRYYDVPGLKTSSHQEKQAVKNVYIDNLLGADEEEEAEDRAGGGGGGATDGAGAPGSPRPGVATTGGNRNQRPVRTTPWDDLDVRDRRLALLLASVLAKPDQDAQLELDRDMLQTSKEVKALLPLERQAKVSSSLNQRLMQLRSGRDDL